MSTNDVYVIDRHLHGSVKAMRHEFEMRKEVFGEWLADLRKKASMIQRYARMITGEHGYALEEIAKDCEKLYQLGYEIGYVKKFGTQHASASHTQQERLKDVA